MTDAPAGVAELVRDLISSPADGAAWDRLEALDAEARKEVVRGLKARVDALVRSAPLEAGPAAEVLVRAAALAPELEALALRGRGVAAHFAGRSAEAAADFERAAELYAARGEEVEAARVRRSMVEVYQMAGRTDEALRCAELAAGVFAAKGEEQLLGELELNLGNLYTRLDEYPRARESYGRARERFRRLGEETMLAFTDFNLAVVEMNANRCDEAERALRSARAGLLRADMGVHVADCDYSLAYLESRRGRFEPAVRGLEEARAAYDGVGKPSGPPLCDLDLAEIHLRLDARRDALALADRAAERFEELDMRYELARAELLRGLSAHRLGRAQEAARDLESAGRAFGELGNEAWASAVAIQQSAIEVEAGRADEVLPVLERAREELASRHMFLLADLAALVEARALLALARPDDALGLLAARSLDGSSGVVDGLLDSEARCLAAEAHLAKGERERAAAVLREAVSEIERTYAAVPSGDLRVAFFRDRHAAFVDLAWLLAESGAEGADAEALAYFERGRARSLDEAHAFSRDQDPDLARAREQLDWLLSRRLDREIFPSGGDHELRPMPPDDEEIERAQRDVHRLAESARRARGPVPAGAARRAVEAEELSASLVGDEVALCYASSRGAARVFVVTREGVESLRLAAEERELAELRDRLRLHVDKLRLGREYVRRRRAALERTTNALLAELGARLLGPVAERVAGRPLLIVPYGVLHDLPFHAFRVADRYLVELSDVGYGLALRHVARLRAERASPGRARVLAAVTEDPSLPSVREEVRALEACFPGRVERIPGADVARRLGADPPPGGILHLAGHGRYEAKNPRFSGVALGDTFLLACDLRALELALDHVTLSGCDTGRKRRVAGEELFGLTHAFLGAGARSVLGSLWAVEDRDATRLTGAFYGELAKGATVRRAVSEAQRGMLAEDGAWPVSWASFVAIGDPSVTLEPEVGG